MSEIIDFYTRIKYKKDNMIKEDDILDDLDIYDAILELEYDTIVYYDEKLLTLQGRANWSYARTFSPSQERNELQEVAKNKGYDVIDEILLVGGSTRMPQVKKALAKNFSEIEIKILEPDEAVAKGAAIYAVNVYEKNQKILTEQNFNSDEEVKVVVDGNEKTLNAKDYEENLAFSPEMMNIGGSVKEIIMATTKSFAIKIIKNGKEMCFNMIIKNESMPNGIREVSEVFGTLYPNQKSVSIEIYENDCMDKYFEIEEELKLGDTILELPGNLPQNSPIEVTLKLSNEGILQVTGLDKTGNRKIEAKMKAKGIMSEEEFEKVNKIDPQILNAFSAYANDLTEIMYLHMDDVDKEKKEQKANENH